MATKFNLRQQAIKTTRTSLQTQQLVVESLTRLHSGDLTAAIKCMEGVVDVLGTLQARVSAEQPIVSNIPNPREQRMLMGIIAGAKVLMDFPEAAEAHNLTANRLRDVIQQADLNTNAAQTMVTIASSAPTVLSDVVRMIHRYNAALQSGEQSVIDETKAAIQQLWTYWQRFTPTLSVDKPV